MRHYGRKARCPVVAVVMVSPGRTASLEIYGDSRGYSRGRSEEAGNR